MGDNDKMSAVLREVPAPSETIHLEGSDWCELTSIGLKVKRKAASFEEMEHTLNQLMITGKGSPLALGDAMDLGEKRHGEKWAQAVDVNRKTGVKVKTLLEYQRVSQNVAFSIRMENQNVEWSHYQVIANQPKDLRASWVKAVAKHGWTVVELKREIRARQSPAVHLDDDKDYLDPHFKQLLLNYIASQYSFLSECNYEPFKLEIERTIRAARYQHARTPMSDYEAVRDQVDRLCTTAVEIAEEVPISEEEITRICHLIVEKQPDLYEWRPIGANTEMARGSRALGIFRKDSPHYESGGYSPTVDWEE